MVRVTQARERSPGIETRIPAPARNHAGRTPEGRRVTVNHRENHSNFLVAVIKYIGSLISSIFCCGCGSRDNESELNSDRLDYRLYDIPSHDASVHVNSPQVNVSTSSPSYRMNNDKPFGTNSSFGRRVNKSRPFVHTQTPAVNGLQRAGNPSVSRQAAGSDKNKR